MQQLYTTENLSLLELLGVGMQLRGPVRCQHEARTPADFWQVQHVSLQMHAP